MQGLTRSMSLEHRRALRDWILGHRLTALRCPSAHAGDRFCLHCIESAEPPALVRAAWVLIFTHVEREAPVTLPPTVARVYLDHQDAVPGRACEGCGYLLPARGGRLAYDGACPVCDRAVTEEV